MKIRSHIKAGGLSLNRSVAVKSSVRAGHVSSVKAGFIGTIAQDSGI